MEKLYKPILVGGINIVVSILTILRQIIGYGTTPKIKETASDDFEYKVNEIVNNYNKDYFIEIAIAGFILLMLNLFLLKNLDKPFLKSILLVIAYLIISVISLLILSERFKRLHLN